MVPPQASNTRVEPPQIKKRHRVMYDFLRVIYALTCTMPTSMWSEKIKKLNYTRFGPNSNPRRRPMGTRCTSRDPRSFGEGGMSGTLFLDSTIANSPCGVRFLQT